MVYTAAAALAGACVLGLYLGIQPSLNHPGDTDETAIPASAAPSLKPGMAAAVEATPLKTEMPPPSSAPPAQLAQAARPKVPASDADQAPASDAAANGPQPGANASPEPPTLYSPDETPAPPPAAQSNNTPPY
jgi:hypothetical protein